MPNLPDLKPWIDQIKRELEDTVYFPPEWAVDRLRHNLAEAIAKAIPECFNQSLQQIIARSIENTVGDALARSVAEGVERAIKPLLGEFSLWREAMERYLEQLRLDQDDWWRYGRESEEDDPDSEE